MKRIIFIISILVIVVNVNGQLNFIESKIDQKDLRLYISVLSSDSLSGRLTGTIGQKKAANVSSI